MRLTLLMMMICSLGFGQVQTKQGILRATSTFGIGVMPSYTAKPLSLTGHIEYFLDDHFSVAGEGSTLLDNGVSSEGFVQNHQLSAGLNWFGSGFELTPYAGLQFGMSAAQYGVMDTLSSENSWLNANRTTSISVNPITSFKVGVSYFAEKWFSAFAQVKYVAGRYFSEIPLERLNEVRIEFGLAFHLNTNKGE